MAYYDTEVSARFKGIVHYLDGAQIYASRGHKIYSSSDFGESWQLLVKLPLNVSSLLKCTSKLSRRLFRAGVHLIQRVGDENLVIFAFNQIFSYDLANRKLRSKTVPLVGSRPLVLCNDGKRLFYGEYKGNPDREPVHIFCTEDNGISWNEIHRFTGIRHIHGVCWDEYAKSIWITTGDEDGECGLWKADEKFYRVERILGSGQQQRAVQPLFTEEYVYYGTDTPLEKNYIYRLSRRTGAVKRMAMVEGSVFYGCKAGDRLFFSTVCEPSKVNTSKDVVVWASNNKGEDWRPIISFRKDIWPMKLFQYGQVRFPAGENPGPYLWLTPQGTNNDQISMRIKVL